MSVLSKKKALERIFVFQAVEYGYLTQEQLKECVEEHDKCDPPIPLLTICKQRRYLSPSQVNHLMSKRLDSSVAKAFGEGLAQREETRREPISPALMDTVIEKAPHFTSIPLDEKEEYERRLSEKDRMLERTQKQTEFLKRKYEELEQKLNNYEQMKLQLLDRKQKEIDNLEEAILCHKRLEEQQKEKLEVFRINVEEKESQLKREQQKAKGLFNLLEQSGRELRETEEQRLKSEAELEKRAKEIEFFKIKLEKESKEKLQLEKQIEICEEEIRHLNRTLEDAKKKNVQVDLQKQTTEIVKKELEKKSKEQTALLAKLKEKDQVEATLAEKIEEIKQKYEQLNEKMRQEYKEQQKKLEEEKNQMEEEFHQNRINLESDLSQFKQKNENLESKLFQYQENLKSWDELEKQKDEMKKQVEEEKKKRIEIEKEKQSIVTRLKQMEDKLARFQMGKFCSTELESGTVLPGSDGEYYIIQKVLGRGGMGIAYSALRGSNESVVVVKTLFAEAMNDMKVLMRFVQEARTIMSFNHENLVKGYDLYQGRSLTYFVMEFLDGESIEDMLEAQGLIDQIEATRIVLGIAKALDYLEKHALVHRDVKPANIIVNSDGIAKLLDFGTVKMTDKTCSLTTEGIILGTPYYLSPEQTYQTNVDIRSDIYCLGATYYHMVIGEVPFPGDNPIDVIQKRLVKSPNPIKVKPDLHKSINNIILKMMNKTAKKRHNTAAELVQEMEQVYKEVISS